MIFMDWFYFIMFIIVFVPCMIGIGFLIYYLGTFLWNCIVYVVKNLPRILMYCLFSTVTVFAIIFMLQLIIPMVNNILSNAGLA